jgi:hypothetical protein
MKTQAWTARDVGVRTGGPGARRSALEIIDLRSSEVLYERGIHLFAISTGLVDAASPIKAGINV